ncbi:MAG: hypothetical protein KGV56_01025 [Gammaproteobacteria bacterium]|nr:hypothetical protein [Gammaproteobacteria bacterium]
MNSIMMLLFLLVIVFLLLIFPIKKRRINFDEKGEAIKIYQEEVAHINRQFEKEFIDENEKAQLLAELDKKSALAIMAIEKKTFAYKPSFVPLVLIILGLSVASVLYYRHYQQSGVMRWQAFRENFHGQITEGLFDEKVVGEFIGNKDAKTASAYCFAMQSELLEKYDTNPDALASLASCFSSVSYPQLAEQAIERGLKTKSDHADLNYLVAELQFTKDKILTTDSLDRLTAVIKQEPKHFRAIRLLAINSLNQGNYRQAKFFFTQLKALAPEKNKELSSALDRLLAEIDAKINPPAPEQAEKQPPKAEQKPLKRTTTNPSAVQLSVSVSPKLTDKLTDENTVFIVIKTLDNKLLNATKHILNGANQPLSVVISDNDGEMMKTGNMVGHSKVKLVARITQTGSPIAQTGDLTSAPITIALPQKNQVTEVVIDRKVP